MDITNINCAMLNLNIILGTKISSFFTQDIQMFIDALVIR